MKKKAAKNKKPKRSAFSNTKLMFISIMLLFIVIEALFILKSHIDTKNVQEVAGVSIHK